jgi:four helix bundle protein
MRRAAVSVTNNIAEGHGRWHYQENIQFCRMARGSVEEILDDLNVCVDEEYCDAQVAQELISAAYFLIGKINGYIAYLRRCKQGNNDQDALPLTTHHSLNYR